MLKYQALVLICDLPGQLKKGFGIKSIISECFGVLGFSGSIVGSASQAHLADNLTHKYFSTSDIL